MLIPYGTDTPIYHWPIATGVLIVINVFVFAMQPLMPGGSVDPEFGFELPGYLHYALSHGDGLHPVQWVTSFFIHGGIFHLIGNMIFLWTFGLIVEGKVGPFLFGVLYMGTGITQNIVEQVIFLPFEAMPSLGASSAIYGMMMIALIWAPQDNVSCVFLLHFLLMFRAFFFGVPIFMFGLFYFLCDFSVALFSGFTMGTALLHVMGAVVGLVPGLVFVLMYWVDCEQQDLISMFRELFGGKPLVKPKTKAEKAAETRQRDMVKANRKHTIDRCWNSMDTHLTAGNGKAAMDLFLQMKKLDPKIKWEENLLLRLVSVLQKNKDWDRYIVCSNQYLEQFETRSDQLRLNLAKVYIAHKESPRRAIKTIQGIDKENIDDQQRKAIHQVVRKAQAMIADGAMELGEN